ncbi:MAG: SBBP repeat-containing protein, partial [Bacteroidetes bacterium]|nr:SBBP repeat-containing protein [Bacteroidota bacterium]
MSKKLFLTAAIILCCFNSPANNNPASPLSKSEEIKTKFNNGGFSLSANLGFVENKGQVFGYDGLAHPEVKFVFRQGNTQIFLLEKGIAYQFTKTHYPNGYRDLIRNSKDIEDMEKMQDLQKQIRTETFRMDMTLAGANSNAEITTEGRSADYTNYYNRNVLDVHDFTKVIYHNIYPGIDWVIYTKNGEIKYDFVVKPGADPSLIKMQFTHQEELKLNADGSFTLKNSLGSITEKKPVSFQNSTPIKTKFKLQDNTISFVLENYDAGQTLTIDPSLLWATYYGGSNLDIGLSCATDGSGNVYLAGYTNSTAGIASGGHQNSIGGGTDAYLVKFNSSGVRQWATYYGGSGAGSDNGYSCATDGSGNIYLAGYTNSTAGIASGGHQNTFGGGLQDAFLVKFDGSGVRQWATYYGGSGSDEGFSCATDGSGNVYLAGYTQSTVGIASGGHQNTIGGAVDAFLVKFNGNGVRQWATYYGGSGVNRGHSCATDGSGNVYLAGYTDSNAGIASGGHQNTHGGGNDAFLVKFAGSGVRQWATYYGGSGGDYGYSCATDGSGNVYLTGYTGSNAGIASGGHQNTHGGGDDAFLVKFNGSGVQQWATYY